MLRSNQKQAVETSVNNGFSSGVHHHATGTGKSWIALQLLLEYYRLNPKQNVYWICERKSILTEQFSTKTLRDKGYHHIYEGYHILNFTENKLTNWFTSVNTSPIWGKPALVIINRAFLTQSEKYRLVKIPFGLVIHDECHSITNATTQAFYQYLTDQYPNISCLGFSATPELSIAPLTTCLSHYSIYQAFYDGVIVKPVIKWFPHPELVRPQTLISLIKDQITPLPYRKIIIWAGIIKYCQETAAQWASYFPGYKICVDTSQEIPKLDQKGQTRKKQVSQPTPNDYISYQEFSELESDGLLFCACKHREGSDIKNLDACIFLDGVAHRNARAFVQCVGRVLRKDRLNQKKYGLIIDIAAKSDIKICDRINAYFTPPKDYFPWVSQGEKLKIDGQEVKINTISLRDPPNKQEIVKSNRVIGPESITEAENQDNPDNPDNPDITKYFVRSCPEDAVYQDRLNTELQLFQQQSLGKYLLQAVEILDITKDIPHVTRGSCGSSLVCYLLGISHTDPVAYDISFSRFLNEFRDTLPDIDFDFPHNVRDQVFLRIESRWPGKIARISNHVHYHEKSALREAIRQSGHHEFISKTEINRYVKGLSKSQQEDIASKKKRLLDTFRCYSLHCGGIVYYPEGVPEQLKLRHKSGKNSTIGQVSLNKIDIQKTKHFKIDILSSRGLSQLFEIVDFSGFNFSQHDRDPKTQELFASGNNIGITLAESPLIRKAFLKIAPKCIADVAICLSIIRPMASEARNQEDVDKIASSLVYDDDAISLIKNSLNCSEAEADYFRRGFAKGKPEVKKALLAKLTDRSETETVSLIAELAKLQKYSFCKSHAFSYAQLVWQLAYQKAHHQKAFWRATLNHCESNYRPWVHRHEAKLAGVDLKDPTLVKNHKSIYSQARKPKTNYQVTDNDTEGLTPIYQFPYPNCYLFGNSESYKFRGIIASYRQVRSQKGQSLIAFLGIENNRYLEVVVQREIIVTNQHLGLMGEGQLDKKNMILTCQRVKLF